MPTAESTDMTDLLNRVKTWPPSLRITLARQILESLDHPDTETPMTSPAQNTRGFSATEVRRLIKTDKPPPDDKTV